MQEVPIEYIIDIGVQHIHSSRWQELLGLTALNNSYWHRPRNELQVAVVSWRWWWVLWFFCWTTMVVGSCSFNASHRRSTGLLLMWWWAVVVSMFLIEDQLYYCNERSTVFLAATKQLYDWFSPSVCPSVCPSVRHTFFTMFPSSYHHEIFRSYYQRQKWCPCKRSRLGVKGQGHRGQHPT